MKRWVLCAALLGFTGCPWVKIVGDVATTIKDICEVAGATHTIRTGGATLSCPPRDMGLTDAASAR